MSADIITSKHKATDAVKEWFTSRKSDDGWINLPAHLRSLGFSDDAIRVECGATLMRMAVAAGLEIGSVYTQYQCGLGKAGVAIVLGDALANRDEGEVDIDVEMKAPFVLPDDSLNDEDAAWIANLMTSDGDLTEEDEEIFGRLCEVYCISALHIVQRILYTCCVSAITSQVAGEDCPSSAPLYDNFEALNELLAKTGRCKDLNKKDVSSFFNDLIESQKSGFNYLLHILCTYVVDCDSLLYAFAFITAKIAKHSMSVSSALPNFRKCYDVLYTYACSISIDESSFLHQLRVCHLSDYIKCGNMNEKESQYTNLLQLARKKLLDSDTDVKYYPVAINDEARTSLLVAAQLLLHSASFWPVLEGVDDGEDVEYAPSLLAHRGDIFTDHVLACLKHATEESKEIKDTDLASYIVKYYMSPSGLVKDSLRIYQLFKGWSKWTEFDLKAGFDALVKTSSADCISKKTMHFDRYINEVRSYVITEPQQDSSLSTSFWNQGAIANYLACNTTGILVFLFFSLSFKIIGYDL